MDKLIARGDGGEICLTGINVPSSESLLLAHQKR